MNPPSIQTQTIPLQTLANDAEPLSWQEELQCLVRSPKELAELLALPLDAICNGAHGDFELRLTRHFAALIEKGQPKDPLLQQILPAAAELDLSPGYSAEPLEESAQFNPAPGLIHKYQGRVLLMAANQCAINCRYCFRRHFPYQDHHLGRKQWQQSLDYIRNEPSISEAILSGGDPLSLNDKQLSWLTQTLAEIPHLRRLRIHSRLPVVLPNRVDEKLLEWISNVDLHTSLVLHINHPQELSPELKTACQRLRKAGVRLYNQSVLLKGINDDAPLLAQLSEDLFEWDIQPYYLHQLDRVQGAAHFRVDDSTAKAIYHQLRALLPGYLVPLLTQEIPGEAAKTPLI